MLFSVDIRDTIAAELNQSDNIQTVVTSGAELEFLPLADFPIYRLKAEILEKLKPIYKLSELDGDLIARQPHFNRLIQMLVTVALINHYADIEHPGKLQYRAKLNREDFEKHKQAMLKTAYKYDNRSLLKPVNSNYLKALSYFSIFFQTIKKNIGHFYPQKRMRQKFTKAIFRQEISLVKNPIEQAVKAIFERLELLDLVELPGDNVLKVGVDGSVHGTNRENIQYYEKLYNRHRDKRFRFRIYSGQEIGFPVCDSIEETSNIYKFVVSTLKKNGVHFTTTSGVHLHVGIKKKGNTGETTESIINHLANITSASAAVSQILDKILPPTRRSNIYAMPFGDKVDEHIAHYKRRISKLEYIQKKIDMVKHAVTLDPDLFEDEDAAMYEFVLGVAYGIAPVQHEYNYKKILELSAKSPQDLSRKASIIVRNPRYTSINITPLLNKSSMPTYEWRVLASCEDSELQSKFFSFLYRVIEIQNECISTRLLTDYQTNQDYVNFQFRDGRTIQMENSLENWLILTNCNDLFSQSDFEKIENEAYWKYYDAKNQEYIDPEANLNWAAGQFYPAPQSHVNESFQVQDLAILQFLNDALNI